MEEQEGKDILPQELMDSGNQPEASAVQSGEQPEEVLMPDCHQAEELLENSASDCEIAKTSDHDTSNNKKKGFFRIKKGISKFKKKWNFKLKKGNVKPHDGNEAIKKRKFRIKFKMPLSIIDRYILGKF